jgi:two-component system chemotaxis response regulator CheB
MTVVAQAKNGLEAVEMTKRLRPDVVTMDILMPILDGFEAIRRIMLEAPTPIVVISGSGVHEVGTSLNALRLGALAVLEKPAGPAIPGFEERCRTLIENVRLMAEVKVVRRFPRRLSVTPRIPNGPGARARAIAIAASTGGPAALQSIFSVLPDEFPVPILVVQHIAKGFAKGLATWLDGAGRVRVKIAEAGEPLTPGVAFLAPDDRHLGVGSDGRVLVSDRPPLDGFRPAGTFLFESAAEALGPATLALILTGMGRDGVEGLRRVKAAGGHVLAQDEASSAVFGMPAAAIEAGLADEVLGLDAMAGRLVALVA